MEIDNIEEMVEQSLFEENFDDLECEVFECYNCNWVGEHCFEQPSDLFDDEGEIMLLCPVCGSLIN